MEIEARKTVLVYQRFAAANGQLSQQILVPFVPDEVIVKVGSLFVSSGGAPSLAAIQTDLILSLIHI